MPETFLLFPASLTYVGHALSLSLVYYAIRAMLNSRKVEMLFRLCIIEVHSSPRLSYLKSKEVLPKRCFTGDLTRASLRTARQSWTLFPCSIGNGCSQPLSACLLGGVKTTKPSPWSQVLSPLVESGCSAAWSSMLSSAFLCRAHSSALPEDFVLFLCMVYQLLTLSWLLPCRGLERSCCCLFCKLWMKRKT